MQKYENLICAVLRGEKVLWPGELTFSSDDFYQVCLDHNVSALVYYSLVQSGAVNDWPAELISQLHNSFLKLSAVELFRVKELQEIISLFEKKGIMPILMKGVALSYSHYPLPYLRERSDTDLFIDFDAIQSVQNLMLKRGYTIDYPLFKSHQFTCYRMDDKDKLYHFDVHWRVSNKSQFARIINYQEALSCSVEFPEQVPGARFLSSVHALLLACIHLEMSTEAIKDDPRLFWVYDIHLLAMAMSKEKQVQFAELAVAKGAQNICLKAINMSQDRFPTKLVDEAEELLSAPVPDSSFFEHLKTSNIGLYLDDLRVLPGFWLKIKLIGELLFPPPSYLLAQYKKTNKMWYPWLLIKHIFLGALKRLMLR